MKNILSILTVLAIVFALSSCGNKKKKDTVDTHTHEDGTVHANDAHSHDNDSQPAQESFEVKEENDTEHKHEDGNLDGHNHDSDDHDHGDETGHDHDHEHGDHK